MPVLEQEIMDTRQITRQYEAGKIDTERFLALLMAHKLTAYNVRTAFKLYVEAAPFQNRPLKKAIRANLIGDGTAIDLVTVSPEEEKVKCPGMDFDLIKRSKCLDHSGSQHFEDCTGCDNGLSTKKLLLPETQ